MTSLEKVTVACNPHALQFRVEEQPSSRIRASPLPVEAHEARSDWTSLVQIVCDQDNHGGIGYFRAHESRWGKRPCCLLKSWRHLLVHTKNAVQIRQKVHSRTRQRRQLANAGTRQRRQLANPGTGTTTPSMRWKHCNFSLDEEPAFHQSRAYVDIPSSLPEHVAWTSHRQQSTSGT